MLKTTALVTAGICVLVLASVSTGLGSQGYGFGPAVWAVLVGVGVATAAVNFLWYHPLAKVGASRASLYSNLQPFFVVLMSLALLGENVTRWTILGGGVITAGLVTARRQPRPGARLTTAPAD